MEEKKILDDLHREFAEKILETSTALGDLTIVIARDVLLEVIRFLKQPPHRFEVLLDLTCVDYAGRTPRFEMVYHILALSDRRRLRIKLGVGEEEPEVDSLSLVWKNANWLEREVYDMFGLRFKGHPDLRRLFLYDGFEGYPLRKDYPLRKRQPMIPLRK